VRFTTVPPERQDCAATPQRPEPPGTKLSQAIVLWALWWPIPALTGRGYNPVA